MILTLWRHGEAEQGADDRQRQLTAAGSNNINTGCDQFHEACNARGLRPPERILHSPWVRTHQTAMIIAAAFLACPVVATGALQPGSNVAAVDAVLGADDPQEHRLLVLHQPLISALVDHFLGTAGRVPFLTPGGLVTVSLDIIAPDCGKVIFWAFPPTYETGI